MRTSNGKITRAQKCVAYGCEGVGKSSFASKFPKPIFADLEGGTSHLDVVRIEDISRWDNLISAIEELTKDNHGFKTFVLDTADWAERMCSAYLCRVHKKKGIEDFGYGKGYQFLAEEFAEMLGKLTALQESGMHVVVLAHSMIRKLELPEETGAYDHYELKCSKVVSPLLKEWADGLLFANFRTNIQMSSDGKGKAIGGKERVLYVEHTAFADGKNRWGLEGILPLEFKSVASVFGEIPTPVSEQAPTLLEKLNTQMTMSGISPDELNAFLRGKNDTGKVLISDEQTFENLPNATLEKLISEESWAKVEAQIAAGRTK